MLRLNKRTGAEGSGVAGGGVSREDLGGKNEKAGGGGEIRKSERLEEAKARRTPRQGRQSHCRRRKSNE